MEKLTPIETWNLQVAKQVLLNGQFASPSLDSIQNLFDMIDRLTSPKKLPCKGCGSCLDCLRLERDNIR
jgi:hypothetical protein